VLVVVLEIGSTDCRARFQSRDRRSVPETWPRIGVCPKFGNAECPSTRSLTSARLSPKSKIEECRHLLTSVIEHAPILRNMSIPGFRNTFLLRKGQLSARDGIWRLRVERETYDVVLDRFPWSVSWLKLPWMEFPMHVEWQHQAPR
jgi:hypothetical protein